MGEHILPILADFFQEYGYWTILGGLLLENAGVPVPGETILLDGSFLASSKHTLNLPYIVIVAIIAAVIGDNIGYAIGRFGGRPLLDRYKRLLRLSDETIRKGSLRICREPKMKKSNVFVLLFCWCAQVCSHKTANSRVGTTRRRNTLLDRMSRLNALLRVSR